MNVEKTCGSFGKEIIEDFNGIEFPILRDALEPQFLKTYIMRYDVRYGTFFEGKLICIVVCILS